MRETKFLYSVLCNIICIKQRPKPISDPVLLYWIWVFPVKTPSASVSIQAPAADLQAALRGTAFSFSALANRPLVF